MDTNSFVVSMLVGLLSWLPVLMAYKWYFKWRYKYAAKEYVDFVRYENKNNPDVIIAYNGFYIYRSNAAYTEIVVCYTRITTSGRNPDTRQHIYVNRNGWSRCLHELLKR